MKKDISMNRRIELIGELLAKAVYLYHKKEKEQPKIPEKKKKKKPKIIYIKNCSLPIILPD